MTRYLRHETPAANADAVPYFSSRRWRRINAVAADYAWKHGGRREEIMTHAARATARLSSQFLAALAIAILAANGAAAQVTALTNVTLIDGTGAAPQSSVTIVMQGGRISAIGRDVKAPAGATVIDLSGKYVVPGIINGHGHVGPAPHGPAVRQYASYGVTTTTSMGSDPDAIIDYKARTRAGDIRGSRVLTVMYRFTTMLRPGAGYDYRTPEAARGKVDEIAKKGADMLKVWVDAQGGKVPRLSREMVRAIVDQGRNYNLITGAHIVELADANMVIDEGVQILLHNVRDQEVGTDFIAKLKDRRITVISTLAREEAMFAYGNDGPGFTDNPFFTKAVPPEHLTRLKEQVRPQQAKMPTRNRAIRALDTDKNNLKKMADAGVRFGFGTDSGDLRRFLIAGFFEHRQMELMIQAGLTPMQVIQAFSKNNSEAYGIDKDFGTLALGKAADLLVLTKNPLENILNMRTLEAVYIGGKKLE
jgi:imidazolonepropionase-like amidohydrolase